MLPDGWRWLDPRSESMPWRARCDGPGVRLEVEAISREGAAALAVQFEAGRAAVTHPDRASGWAFNHSHGFVP